MEIYVTIRGKQEGPYQIEQINAFIAQKKIRVSESLAWYEGCSGWIKLKDVPGIKISVSKPPPLPLKNAVNVYGSAQPYEMPKPKIVRSAVTLLWWALGIGIIRFGLEFPFLVEESSVDFVLKGWVVVLLFGIFLICMISCGENWARITNFILFVFGTPFFIISLFNSFTCSPLSTILGIIQVILEAVAIVFLFMKESSIWFKLQKSK